jgi:putative membrane protein insertion efficiency factor
MRYVLAVLITLYQKLFSSWLPPTCRYTPTCSQYAKEAVLKHGFLRGTGLALKRLSRCHPFHEGGYDPVP